VIWVMAVSPVDDASREDGGDLTVVHEMDAGLESKSGSRSTVHLLPSSRSASPGPRLAMRQIQLTAFVIRVPEQGWTYRSSMGPTRVWRV
jgi:hypothetical protein